MAKAAVVLLVVAIAAAAPRAQSPARTLRSFYIGSRAGFGIWSDKIVSVEPVGQDTRVRAMRFVSVNAVCPHVRVAQAAERLVRNTTVQVVARLPICDMSQHMIDEAIAKSKTPRMDYIDYMGGGLTVVADCGGQQRVFDLYDKAPWVNFDTLRRRYPAVSALWDLSSTLSKGMLPDYAQEPAPEVETLGTQLLPEFRSPKYATVFGDRLVTALKDYTGPPTPREPLPEVLERDALPLSTYVAPKYPPIAVSARMSDDVRLRVFVDALSGAVKEVETVSGRWPILDDAAVAAVRGWKFDTARLATQPVDVTVRFELQCRQN
jgi:TonB family protein